MPPESAEAYYARLVVATDADGRLPSIPGDGMSEWDIFPYETDSLVVRPLRPLLDDEPARRGEDPAECWCATGEPNGIVWSNDRWVVTASREPVLPVELFLQPKEHFDLPRLPRDMAAELGRLTVALAAAVESLPSVGRAHVNKWGDGGAHLHLFVLGRPARIGQLRGSPLADWMEHLSALPAEVAAGNLDHVLAELARQLG